MVSRQKDDSPLECVHISGTTLSWCPASNGLKDFFFSFREELFKRMLGTAEQTLLSKTTDRCPLSSIGLDAAACHLSHLNGPRGDPSVASELYTLLALTQSNARSALGGSRRWQPLRCPRAQRGPTPVTSST